MISTRMNLLVFFIMSLCLVSCLKQPVENKYSEQDVLKTDFAGKSLQIPANYYFKPDEVSKKIAPDFYYDELGWFYFHYKSKQGLQVGEDVNSGLNKGDVVQFRVSAFKNTLGLFDAYQTKISNGNYLLNQSCQLKEFSCYTSLEKHARQQEERLYISNSGINDYKVLAICATLVYSKCEVYVFYTKEKETHYIFLDQKYLINLNTVVKDTKKLFESWVVKQ